MGMGGVRRAWIVTFVSFALGANTFGEKEGATDFLVEASVDEQQKLESVVAKMVEKVKGNLKGVDSKSAKLMLEFMKRNDLLAWPEMVSFAGANTSSHLKEQSSHLKEQTFGREPCTPPFCRYRCAREPAKLTAKQLAWPKGATCPEGSYYPIAFGIPEENVVDCVPEKFHDFSPLVPGMKSTYKWGIYQESEYYRHYRNSMYGLARQKHGWDCYRHYEMLSSAVVPFFLNLENAPKQTLRMLPKDLIIQLRDLPGLPKFTNYSAILDTKTKIRGYAGIPPRNDYMDVLKIDHSKFDMEKYLDLSAQLLAFTQQRLTTKAIAKYVLQKLKNPNPKKVLFLRNKKNPDYSQDLLHHGLVSLLGPRVVEFPYADHVYDFEPDTGLIKNPKSDGIAKRKKEAARTNQQSGQAGIGFTFRLIPDKSVSREKIPERIAAKEFDLVVYGSSTSHPRGARFWKEISKAGYKPDQVGIVFGEDTPEDRGSYKMRKRQLVDWGKAAQVFVRELEDGCPSEWKGQDGKEEGYWYYDGWGLTTDWRKGRKPPGLCCPDYAKNLEYLGLKLGGEMYKPTYRRA